MSKGMAVVLTLLVLSAAVFAGWYSGQRTLYFPSQLQATMNECRPVPEFMEKQPVQDDFEASWFSAELSAFHEPSLFHRPQGNAVRFTYLRSFHDPVVVRVNMIDGEPAWLTAKQRPGGHGFGPALEHQGPRAISRALTHSEIDAVVNLKTASALAAAPSSGCSCCPDGSRWIIEINDPETGYRYHSAQSPREGAIYDTGLALLSLTGWRFDRIY